MATQQHIHNTQREELAQLEKTIMQNNVNHFQGKTEKIVKYKLK